MNFKQAATRAQKLHRAGKLSAKATERLAATGRIHDGDMGKMLQGQRAGHKSDRNIMQTKTKHVVGPKHKLPGDKPGQKSMLGGKKYERKKGTDPNPRGVGKSKKEAPRPYMSNPTSVLKKPDLSGPKGGYSGPKPALKARKGGIKGKHVAMGAAALGLGALGTAAYRRHKAKKEEEGQEKSAMIPTHPSMYSEKYNAWAEEANKPEHLEHLNKGLARHAKKMHGKELHELDDHEWKSSYEKASKSPRMRRLHKKHFGY